MQILWKSMMPGMMLTLFFKALGTKVHRTPLFWRVPRRETLHSCVSAERFE